MAPPGHKNMVAMSTLDDIALTSEITGLPTNMLRPSLNAFGIDITSPRHAHDNAATANPDNGDEPRNWRDLWSAGHSTSGVRDIPTVADLTHRLVAEYRSPASSWSRPISTPAG
jgi:nitronate monooxygenase